MRLGRFEATLLRNPYNNEKSIESLSNQASLEEIHSISPK